MKSLSKFQETQLKVTLERSSHHPFYMKHWASIDVGDLLQNLGVALEMVPPVRKSHLESEIVPVLEDGDEIVGVSFSSGSTGKIVKRYSSRREADEIEGLLSQVALRSEGVPKPVHLEFLSSWHGVGVTRQNRRSVVLPGNAADDARMKRTLDLIRSPILVESVDTHPSTMSGGVLGVYAFTRYLQDQGVHQDEFAMRAIGVFGGYLSDRRRDVMEDYWRCSVINSFSVSELRGKAIVCAACGHLAFEPQLIPLSIALDGDEKVDAGVGRLTLTELYPFGIAQPLIKYLTGDLVEYIPNQAACSPEHMGGLRRVGREESSVFIEMDGERRLAISSQEIYEIFDCDGVLRIDTESGVRLNGVDDLGQPHVVGRSSRGKTRELVDLRFVRDKKYLDPTEVLRAMVLKTLQVRLGAASERVDLQLSSEESVDGLMPKFA